MALTTSKNAAMLQGRSVGLATHPERHDILVAIQVVHDLDFTLHVANLLRGGELLLADHFDGHLPSIKHTQVKDES